MEERRKSKRFNLDLLANVTVYDKQQKEAVFTSHTRDISSEGAFIKTLIPLEEGTPVQLELYLSLNRLLSLIGEKEMVKLVVSGKVLRANLDGIAIVFHGDNKITTIDEANEKT